MGRFLLTYCILCFLQLLFFLSSYSSTLVPLCNRDEASALLQFRNSFTLNSLASHWCDQSNYPKTESWEIGTNCCMWDGVTCDAKSGYVIGLDLSCSWLQGEFHPNSTLFQLTHLQKLNLAFNDFFHSPMVSGFSDLVTLTHLNLSSSGFSGVIPTKISQLWKLVSLDLSPYTWYSWSDDKSLKLDPSTWKNLILNATNLRDLSLSFVDMSTIRSSSLSLLMNLSSSLVSLNLAYTQLHGNLANDVLCLPNLQNIDLSLNENLKGQLPMLNWSTPLRYLDLSYTAFQGEVPDSIGNLQSLNQLYLSGCKFNGLIPLSLGNLTQLTFLGLESNKFSGEIPSSISNLQHLTSLVLSANKFSGHIPYLLGNLSKLTYLSLHQNNLEGQLPSTLFDLTQLSYLVCSHNKLVGSIPDNIGRLSNLDRLDLSYNKLQGNIPKSMFHLVNLAHLYLSSNNLSGFLDFDRFSKLHSLYNLDLSHNNFLSLNFDSNVDYTFPNLEGLYLSSCNISSFPKFLARVQNLRVLDLSNNKIHGRIPEWFNKHLSLLWKNIFLDLSSNMLQGDLPVPPFGTQFFSVSNNSLAGEISSAICNASSLIILDLSHNNLSGMIPQCLGTFPFLQVLDLQMNKLNGIIPRDFSQKNVLETIKFNSNQLQGPLPQSLVHCKKLEVLDLGKNNIEDTFPSWLESLQGLQVLVLRGNKFHGVITPLRPNHTFPKLRIFDVSNNFFNGPLPIVYIKNFKGMMNLSDGPIGLHYMQNLQYSYNDSVVLVVKGNDIEMERILTIFTTIDLSNNMFEGEIPEVIGGLNSLIGLNLSHNRITGNIPQSLGNLTSLEWLDLSSNKLTGKIPSVLTNLNSLSVLNLSKNQLEGSIPTGKQFNTFEIDSYMGNPGLCGMPLPKPCKEDEEHQPDSTIFHHIKEHFGFGWKSVAVGYACGVLFGMLLGYIVFSTGKPQWLVSFFEGVPNKRMTRRSNRARASRR